MVPTHLLGERQEGGVKAWGKMGPPRFHLIMYDFKARREKYLPEGARHQLKLTN